jgi:hypothetical protein
VAIELVGAQEATIDTVSAQISYRMRTAKILGRPAPPSLTESRQTESRVARNHEPFFNSIDPEQTISPVGEPAIIHPYLRNSRETIMKIDITAAT